MRSILYPNQNFPPAYYSNSRDDLYSLILLSLIIIILIFSYILYVFKNSQKFENVVSPCPAGYCGTNIETGDKRCPASLQQKVYVNPAIEVCNPRDYCTALETPYALLPDGSVNINGICTSDMCGCVRVRTCPNYASVMFIQDPNNPINFTQLSIGTIATGGVGQRTLTLNDTCLVDPSLFVNIGCDPNLNPLACVQSNPCTTGIFSYIPNPNNSPTDFVLNPENFNSSLAACIPGQVCKEQEVSVYNSKTNVAECINLPN